MSNLAVAFMRRQPARGGSDSTVSSREENIRLQSNFEELPAQNPLTNDSNFVFNSCKDIRVGEQVTNIYMSYLAQDCKNAAFILNDKNVSAREKILYILAQQWCWGLMFLVSLMVGFILVLMLVVIMVKQVELLKISRQRWGARDPNPLFPLVPLRLPVSQIIVTHTNDNLESCFTEKDCIERVRKLQDKYYDELGDIPYNFLIGNDGSLFEGRGFANQSVLPGNSSSTYTGFVIAFIGTYINVSLSQRQIDVFDAFLRRSTHQDLMSTNVTLLLADQLVKNGPMATGLHEMLRNRNNFYELQEIISRAEWAAAPPLNQSIFTYPVKNIYVEFRVNEFCTSLEDCKESLGTLQRDDMTYMYNDIIHNFMISPYGIFEGRSWDWKPELVIDQIDGNVTTEPLDFFIIGILITLGSDMTYQKDVEVILLKVIHDGIVIGKLDENYILGCQSSICNLNETTIELVFTADETTVTVEDTTYFREETTIPPA